MQRIAVMEDAKLDRDGLTGVLRHVKLGILPVRCIGARFDQFLQQLAVAVEQFDKLPAVRQRAGAILAAAASTRTTAAPGRQALECCTCCETMAYPYWIGSGGRMPNFTLR